MESYFSGKQSKLSYSSSPHSSFMSMNIKVLNNNTKIFNKDCP